MLLRTLLASLLLGLCFCFGCIGHSGGFRTPYTEQHLSSGKTIKVTSCMLVWSDEHGDPNTNNDSFALEYVTTLPLTSKDELDQEALEAFELIRPVSERWNFATASVAAFASLERTGKYNIWEFSRSSAGAWSFKRRAAKVYNTESGDK